MTRLPVALGLLILAALFAVVAYVLARPRWRWEPEPVPWHYQAAVDAAKGRPPSVTHFTFPDGTVGPGDWNPITQRVEPSRPGSPSSMTVCGFNHATAWSAAVNTPDDAARWAGG